jgi:ribosomal protein S2
MFFHYFTIKKFIDYNIYLGHVFKKTYKQNYPYLLGIRSNFAIINVEHTLLAFRTALMFVFSLKLHKRERLCFLSINKVYSNFIKYIAIKARQAYFVDH